MSAVTPARECNRCGALFTPSRYGDKRGCKDCRKAAAEQYKRMQVEVATVEESNLYMDKERQSEKEEGLAEFVRGLRGAGSDFHDFGFEEES